MKYNTIALLPLIFLFNMSIASLQNNLISQINGTIVDSKTNVFLNDVIVVLSITGDIASTNSEGFFTFTDLTDFNFTPNQPLQFSFFRPEYVPIYDTLISVNTFGVIKEIIKLKKRRIERTSQSSFQGFVKNNDMPISDVEVTFPQNKSRPVFTNKNGYFYILIDSEHSVADSITLIFRKEGYKTLFKKISKAEEEHEIILKSPELVFFGEITDENGNDLDSAKVELEISTINKVTHTDKSGNYKFAIDQQKIKGLIFKIEVTKDGYTIPKEPFAATIPQPNFINNDFTLQKKDGTFGLVNPAKYLKERNNYPIQFGIGFGLQLGSTITIGDIPSDIRIIPPHVDDLKDRFDVILDTNIRDNYLIYENEVDVKLPDRIRIDLIHASLYGLINITLRTTELSSSGENLDNNLYTKNYIKPGEYGIARIYYTIKTKERTFFKDNSFSLPIYLTYPVLYYGKDPEINRRLILRIMGGTNILLPPKFELVAENGWDRFGSYETQETIDIGEIKEINWFWGLDVEGAFDKSFHFNVQLAFINTKYKEIVESPITLQSDISLSPSISMRISWLINSKK